MLIALCMCMVLMIFSMATIDAGAVVVARARAQAAADLAALAALVPATQPPRKTAAMVAEANGARLADCTCGSTSALVMVERSLQLPMVGRTIRIPARARAITPTEPLFPLPAPPGAPTSLDGVHGSRATARALLTNPRLTLTPNARADLAGGGVDERLALLLSELLRRHRVAVSVFRTGHTRYVAGTRVVSKHVYGHAMDIYMVDGGLVRPGHKPSLHLVAWLATLDGPLRPSEVGSPFPAFEQVPGHFSNSAHLDHVHVAIG